MPNLNANRRQGEIKDHSRGRDEYKQTARDDLARDDLRGDYAGKENSDKGHHSTKLKARDTEKSRAKTPIK